MAEVNYHGTELPHTFMGRTANFHLAYAIRRVADLREQSYTEHGYTKTFHDCIYEVVGEDPIFRILDCLFAVGYTEMFDFCDEVLGPFEQKDDPKLPE